MFYPQLISEIGEDISILINLDNHTPAYLCECGDASGLTVKASQNLAAIFLSHTHIDHFINFDTVLRHQLGIGKRVVICGPAGIAAQVQSKIRAFTWNLVQPGAILYEIREIISETEIRIFELEPPKWALREIDPIAGEVVYRNDRFQVEFTLLDHKIPSVAYLFREHDRVNIDLAGSGYRGGRWVKELKAAYEGQQPEQEIVVDGTPFRAEALYHLLRNQTGATLGIIMDHAASPENHARIKAAFSGCDLVFIECFYKVEDRDFAVQNFHSYSEASGKIMRECRVENAVPVHFSRKYDREAVKELVAEFQVAWKGGDGG